MLLLMIMMMLKIILVLLQAPKKTVDCELCVCTSLCVWTSVEQCVFNVTWWFQVTYMIESTVNVFVLLCIPVFKWFSLCHLFVETMFYWDFFLLIKMSLLSRVIIFTEPEWWAKHYLPEMNVWLFVCLVKMNWFSDDDSVTVANIYRNTDMALWVCLVFSNLVFKVRNEILLFLEFHWLSVLLMIIFK